MDYDRWISRQKKSGPVMFKPNLSWSDHFLNHPVFTNFLLQKPAASPNLALRSRRSAHGHGWCQPVADDLDVVSWESDMGLDLNGKIEGTLTWYYCTMGNFGDFKIPILWFYELVFSCIFMIPHESLILFMIRMGMKFLMVISQQIMRSPWTTNRFFQWFAGNSPGTFLKFDETRG